MSWRQNNGRARTDIDGIMWVLEGPSSDVNCVQRQCICPGSVTGPQGPTGLQGSTGPIGLAAGATGPQGLIGTNGIIGYTGSPGSASSTGPEGMTGSEGIAGIPGVNGPIGLPGSIGPTGQSYPGITGIVGSPADPVVQYTTADNYIYSGIKTFVIQHPLQPHKYLVHACMEGAEAGVYYRGTADIKRGVNADAIYNKVDIYLADYVAALASEFTVYVTPTLDSASLLLDSASFPKLSATSVIDGKFSVYSNIAPCTFDYLVIGKRQAIDSEPEKALVKVKGEGPYKYI